MNKLHNKYKADTGKNAIKDLDDKITYKTEPIDQYHILEDMNKKEVIDIIKISDKQQELSISMKHMEDVSMCNESKGELRMYRIDYVKWLEEIVSNNVI